MRTTQTLLGAQAIQAIRRGVNAIYEPVRRTFGCAGKNALLFRTMNRGNRIVNDGVTVAECIEPRDKFVRQAAQTFKEACKKTNEKVGDATTATVILGGKLFNEIYKKIDDTQSLLGSGGLGTMELKKRILEEAKNVKTEIKKSAKKIKTLEELEKVSIVSVEDEKIGKIVAKMVWDVGVDGYIDVVEGYKGGIETEVIKGMRFPAKVPAKAFVNNPARFEMGVVDCPIIITNHSMDNVGDFAGSFNEINKNTSKLVVVAPAFSENVLVNFVKAAEKGFFIFPVQAPSLRTEQFIDLAIYCEAEFIDKNKGKKMRNITVDDLGNIEKITVKDTSAKEDAVIIGGQGTKKIEIDKENIKLKKTKVEEHIEILKGQLEETKLIQFKRFFERRIASMASAVGIIRVGASTDAQSLYEKLKIEDAVYACKAALRGGYVKGGGLCLKEIAEKLEDGNILKETLLAPYNQIQSSVDGGIDIGEDIIDPAEAIYYAVEHSTQVVANLITCDILVAEEEDPIPESGNFAIAKMFQEFMLSDKINKGQLKEGEREMYIDSLGGMNEYEYEITNRDG